MSKVKEVFSSSDHAKNYDEKAKAANWLGSEILLQLSRQYIHPGECILDLGIGTGLSSVLFRATGLRVYGMDFSAEMLKVCEEKKIAVELKKHDLQEIPYPYETDSMDHAICGGVLHVFKDLNPIFKEVSRIVRQGGSFAFTCADYDNHHDSETKEKANHDHMGKSVTIYQHNQASIEEVLKRQNFELTGSLDFFVTVGCNNSEKCHFKAYVAKNA